MRVALWAARVAFHIEITARYDAVFLSPATPVIGGRSGEVHQRDKMWMALCQESFAHANGSQLEMHY